MALDDGDAKNHQDDVWTEYETSFSNRLLDSLRESAKRNALRGIVLIFSPFVSLLFALFAPPSLAEIYSVPILVLTVALACVGVFLLAYLGTGVFMLVRGSEILSKIDPSPFITESYAVARKNGVLILVRRGYGHLYFLDFLGQVTIPTNPKIHLPRFYWRWEKGIRIAGVKLHHREGQFTIPDKSGEYISGEANLYVTTFYPTKYQVKVPDFSIDELNSIIQDISNQGLT
ncbi:MAG: hypothetical protein ACFFER_14950 [Candidatus Thorarchaeota archaeon]